MSALPQPAVINVPPDKPLDAMVNRAVTELEAGSVIVVPTDTVYGVAAHPKRIAGIERLFALKERDRAKPFAVLAADTAQAMQLFDLSSLDDVARRAVNVLVANAWPGALTLVGHRCATWMQVDLGGDPSTIGVRVPASQVVRAIAAHVGPLVTTSANRSGEATPTSALQAARSLAGDVALVLDAGPGGTVPSTVLDITRVPFVIVRQGACNPIACGLPGTLVRNE